MEEENKQPEQKSIVDEAKEMYEKIKQERTLVEQALSKLQNERAKDIMSGRTEAGQTEAKPKEVDPKTYAENALKGKID